MGIEVRQTSYRVASTGPLGQGLAPGGSDAAEPKMSGIPRHLVRRSAMLSGQDGRLDCVDHDIGDAAGGDTNKKLAWVSFDHDRNPVLSKFE